MERLCQHFDAARNISYYQIICLLAIIGPQLGHRAYCKMSVIDCIHVHDVTSVFINAAVCSCVHGVEDMGLWSCVLNCCDSLLAGLHASHLFKPMQCFRFSTVTQFSDYVIYLCGHDCMYACPCFMQVGMCCLSQHCEVLVYSRTMHDDKWCMTWLHTAVVHTSPADSYPGEVIGHTACTWNPHLIGHWRSRHWYRLLIRFIMIVLPDFNTNTNMMIKGTNSPLPQHYAHIE